LGVFFIKKIDLIRVFFCMNRISYLCFCVLVLVNFAQ